MEVYELADDADVVTFPCVQAHEHPGMMRYSIVRRMARVVYVIADALSFVFVSALAAVAAYAALYLNWREDIGMLR